MESQTEKEKAIHPPVKNKWSSCHKDYKNNIINTINLIISVQLLLGSCIFVIIIIGIGLTYNNKNIQIMGVISYIIYILLFSAIFNIFSNTFPPSKEGGF